MRSYLALVAAFGSALASGATALAQEGGAVFHPGTVNANEAQPVTVTLGQEPMCSSRSARRAWRGCRVW
jgi:hypothetical protein